MQQTPQRRPSFARAVSFLSFGYVLMTLASFITVNFMAIILEDLFYSSALVQVLASDVGMYLLGLPLALVLFRCLPGEPAPLRPARPLTPFQFAGAGFACMALVYLSSFVTEWMLTLGELPTQAPVDEMVETMPAPASLLFVAILPAILEEFTFRWLPYQKLRSFGELPYVLLSGLWFGIFHGNLSQLLFAAVVGCCFAMITYRTGTVIYSMLLHFLINFLSACVLVPLYDTEALGLFLGLWMPAVLALGIGYLAFFHRKLRPGRGKNLPAHPVAAALLNPGMLTMLIVAALSIVLSILM